MFPPSGHQSPIRVQVTSMIQCCPWHTHLEDLNAWQQQKRQTQGWETLWHGLRDEWQFHYHARLQCTVWLCTVCHLQYICPSSHQSLNHSQHTFGNSTLCPAKENSETLLFTGMSVSSRYNNNVVLLTQTDERRTKRSADGRYCLVTGQELLTVIHHSMTTLNKWILERMCMLNEQNNCSHSHH